MSAEVEKLLVEEAKHRYRLKGERAEAVLNSLAERSFLVDWCFPNPKWPDGKELCDLLVVFGDIAIIWQVKDLKLRKDGHYSKSEVEKNLSQLSGAKRKLLELKLPITLQNSRRRPEQFDPTSISRVHLVSALLGEGEEYSDLVSEVRNTPVHVFSREFTEIVLSELDTITDFVGYLATKEQLLATKTGLIVIGGEEELLAYYLQNNRSFAGFQNSDRVLLDGTLWKRLGNRPEYKRKKEADRISYGWDSIINRVHEGSDDYEVIARELARPNRFERRYLSKAFFDAHVRAHHLPADKNCYRRVVTGNGVTYALLFQNDPGRESRRAHLQAFCYVVRGTYKQSARVLGIATESTFRPTSSYDFMLLDKPDWTTEDDLRMKELQRRTGLLTQVTQKHVTEDEYPDK